MKKILIINKEHKEVDKEELSTQRYKPLFSDRVSIIDLPPQAGELLISNNRIIFKAISWCMFPIIWAGDILKIEPIKPGDLRIGDIVVYKAAGLAFAHRLVKTYTGEKGGLYIVTSGEREFRNNQFNNCSGGGVPFDNVLGRVTEIKRGRLCFKPDEAPCGLWSLIQGRLKLSLWILIYRAKQYISRNIAKIIIKTQGVKLYRLCLRRLIRNRVSFLVGTPLIKNRGEINNFRFYQTCEDFSKNFSGTEGLYNTTARVNNRPVGNISLFLETIDNRNVCTLSDFIVRIRYRGVGIGRQLAEKALYLCNKVNIDEIKVVLSEEDKIAYDLFKKLGFRVLI